jgi:3-mercaptopyruvate sulfurtransferase SseA
MRPTKRLINLLTGLVFLGSAGLAWGSEMVDATYVADAAKRGAIIWDVRNAKAYAAGHIPGAVNIDDAGKTLPMSHGRAKPEAKSPR